MNRTHSFASVIVTLFAAFSMSFVPMPAHAFGKPRPQPSPTPTVQPSPTPAPCCDFDLEVYDGDISQGRRVAGAIVQVGSQRQTSDANGFTHFFVDRGTYLIQVDSAGFDHYDFQYQITGPQTGSDTFRVPLVRTVVVGNPPVVTLANPLPEFTNQKAPAFRFTATGQGTLSFLCSMDELVGGAVEPCVSPKSYSLADGTHTFRVVAVDPAGRKSTTALNRFTLDTTAPAVTLSAFPPDQTQDTSASFAFTSTDGKSGIRGFECRLDGSAFTTCASPKSYSGLAVASHVFQVRATDNAGNVGAPSQHSWTIQPVVQPSPTPTPPSTLQRAGDTHAVPNAGAAPIRFPDIAYDSVNNVYLVVHGNGMTSGAFIGADGTPIGAGFQINQNAAWTQGQKVGFSSELGVFLVTWYDSRDFGGNGGNPWGRLVAYENGSPRFVTGEFRINADPGHPEHPGAIVYSTGSHEFFMLWHHLPDNDILGQRISGTGQLLGAPVRLTSSPSDWDTDPGAAYNPVTNEYFVAYASADASGAHVFGQRVRAGDGALLGARVDIADAGGTWIPDVEYNSRANEFLVGWYQGVLADRRVSAAGVPIGSPAVIFSGAGSYDCFSMAYNPVSNTYGAATCGNSTELFAGEIDASGVSGPFFQASADGARNGNYYPVIATSSRSAEWMVSGSMDFATAVVQRITRR